MVKCRLGLDIVKHDTIKNDIWCIINIQYEYKTFMMFKKRGSIELLYNQTSMQFDDLLGVIEDCGGVENFVMNHIKDTIESHSNDNDSLLEKLIDYTFNTYLTREDLKTLRSM